MASRVPVLFGKRMRKPRAEDVWELAAHGLVFSLVRFSESCVGARVVVRHPCEPNQYSFPDACLFAKDYRSEGRALDALANYAWTLSRGLLNLLGEP
jgi:hypothetical protein